MRSLGIYDYFQHTVRFNPAFRGVDLEQDADLHDRLRADGRNVLALLCHDALFKEGYRISRIHQAPLLTALALLSRDTRSPWLKIQGRNRV